MLIMALYYDIYSKQNIILYLKLTPYQARHTYFIQMNHLMHLRVNVFEDVSFRRQFQTLSFGFDFEKQQ